MKWLLDAEKKLAKSLIRWRSSKEGRSSLDEKHLEERAEHFVSEANTILKKRGQKVYEELKKTAKELKRQSGQFR